MTSFRTLIAALALAATTSAFAWIDTGHMVIAAIAQTRLNPKVAQECEKLLNGAVGKEQNWNFVEAACWADDNKDKTSGPWHYINYHFRPDGQATTNKPEEENILVAIQRFSDVLKDRSKPAAERADALRFLIHFVGDVHQPLHAVARDTDEHPNGDRGGNDFPIKAGETFNFMERPPTNLHFLWDMGAGLVPPTERPLDAERYGRILILTNQLLAQYPEKKAKNAMDLDPEHWAQESYGIAQNIVYNLKPNEELTTAYLHTARLFAGQRLTLAGLRLARLLNQLLG